MAPHFTQLVLVYAQQIRKLTYVALTAQFQTEIDAVAAEWRASGALNGAHRARRVTGALRSIRFIFTYFSIFTLLRMTPPTTMGSSAPSSERVATDPLQKGRLQNSVAAPRYLFRKGTEKTTKKQIVKCNTCKYRVLHESRRHRFGAV